MKVVSSLISEYTCNGKENMAYGMGGNIKVRPSAVESQTSQVNIKFHSLSLCLFCFTFFFLQHNLKLAYIMQTCTLQKQRSLVDVHRQMQRSLGSSLLKERHTHTHIKNPILTCIDGSKLTYIENYLIVKQGVFITLLAE